MKKFPITILCTLCALTLCIDASAQTMAFGNISQSLNKGLHANVGAGSGVFLNFRDGDSASSIPLIFSADAEYVFESGFGLGATASLLSVKQDVKEGGDYMEYRFTIDAGWTFNLEKNSIFAKAGVGPGLINMGILGLPESVLTCFTYDFAIGYRFSISDWLGLQISTGISGTPEWWHMIPIRLSINF